MNIFVYTDITLQTDYYYMTLNISSRIVMMRRVDIGIYAALEQQIATCCPLDGLKGKVLRETVSLKVCASSLVGLCFQRLHSESPFPPSVPGLLLSKPIIACCGLLVVRILTIILRKFVTNGIYNHLNCTFIIPNEFVVH